MPPIRVVIANIPEVLLHLMAQAIQAQPDMMLVGQAGNHLEVLHLAQYDVDLIILGTHRVAPYPGICSHLLSEFPHLKILAMEQGSDVRRAYWLGMRQRKVTIPSTVALLCSICRLYQIDKMG